MTIPTPLEAIELTQEEREAYVELESYIARKIELVRRSTPSQLIDYGIDVYLGRDPQHAYSDRVYAAIGRALQISGWKLLHGTTVKIIPKSEVQQADLKSAYIRTIDELVGSGKPAKDN